jgi:hypothetical protein
MTKLNTFAQKANIAWAKAREIYQIMVKKGCHGRKAWGEAVRQAWRFVNVLATGKVTFWKLSDGAITTREIEPLAVHSSDIIKSFNNGLITVWDRVKGGVISFNTFQIL